MIDSTFTFYDFIPTFTVVVKNIITIMKNKGGKESV